MRGGLSFIQEVDGSIPFSSTNKFKYLFAARQVSRVPVRKTLPRQRTVPGGT
jgi:hypothetical protein